MTPAGPTAAELAADFLAGDRWRDPLQQLIACDRLDECGRPLDAALRRVLVEPWEDRHRLAVAEVLEREAGRVACPFCSGEGCAQHGHGDRAGRCDGSGLAPDGRADRAEFIRLGCDSGADPLRQAARGIELLDRHADDWFNFFGPAERPIDGWRLEYAGSRDALWSRGFVAEITLTTADFLAHAGAVFACQPVTAVRLSGREPVGLSTAPVWVWWLANTPELNGSAWVPRAMWEYLPGRRKTDDTSFYDSPEDALSALSWAAVGFGRDLARLPPLPAGAAGR